MNKKLSSLFSDSFAYSFGAILSRFFTFWLLPLTTSYLTPADYGIVGNLALFSTLLIALFQLGFNTSIAPVYYSEEGKPHIAGVIWGAFLTLLANSIFLCILFGIFRSPIASMLLNSPGHSDLVFISLLTTAFTACQFPFNFHLRAQQRARLVVLLCLIDVILANVLLILFVMIWERGAAGVVEAQALSLFLSLIISAAVVLPTLPFSFPWKKVKELIKVGAPVIYGFLGFFLLQSTSRYMIQWYVNEDVSGLFFVGSNFSRVIELGLWGFVSAWIPYFNSFKGKESEGTPHFSHVLSYFVFGMCVVSLCFFLFARPIVHTMVQPPFFPTWKIVGILSLSQALWGVYVISYTGLIMRKKTVLLSCMEIAAGLSCIGWNALLIPLWGMEGAAIATFLGFSTLVVASFAINSRILPVPYETGRLLKATIPFAFVAACSFLPIESLSIYTTLSFVLLFSYCFYLWKIVLTDEEKSLLLTRLNWRKKSCAEYQQS